MTIKKLYRTLLVYRICVSMRYETNGITQKYSDFLFILLTINVEDE